jgi:hypothetical protein
MSPMPNFGTLAGNSRINETIYRCFERVHEGDIQKFVRKFNSIPHDRVQVFHVFWELLLGAYLAECGFQVRSEWPIDGQTPDWCLIDKGMRPQGIVELACFGPDAVRAQDIVDQLGEAGVWCNFTAPNTQRLYASIQKKASKYKPLVNALGIPYVVSVFGEFTASVDMDELEECLFPENTGLFRLYPELSGVLYFEESGGGYQFVNRTNPTGVRPLNIPDGWLNKYETNRD